MFAARSEAFVSCEIEIGRLEIRLMAALALALDNRPNVAEIADVGRANRLTNERRRHKP